MARRRQSRVEHMAVFAFRASSGTAQQIRKAAAADDRRISPYLRRLVERALRQSSSPQAEA